MARKIAVLVAGLLLLIPASALARYDDKDDKEAAGSAVMLTADVDAAVYLTIDVPARETGRERHD